MNDTQVPYTIAGYTIRQIDNILKFLPITGGFGEALGQALWRADQGNMARLLEAFPDYADMALAFADEDRDERRGEE